MKALSRLVLVCMALLCFNSAYAKTYPLKNCKQLNKPKTVLLVHASWCSYCKRFLPTYEAVSNRKDMSGYTFYTYQNDNSGPVCGRIVRSVPTTLTNNMSNRMIGAISHGKLKNFVKSSA